MKRSEIRLTAILCMLLAFGSTVAAEEPRAIDEQHPGYTTYRQYCAACHGVFADGQGPVAGVLHDPPADLSRLSEKYGSPLAQGQLIEFIEGRRMPRSHGSPDMPIWGKKLFEGFPPTPGTQMARRGTLVLIVQYLQAIQNREVQAPGKEE